MLSRKIYLWALILITSAVFWFPFHTADTPLIAQDGDEDEACTSLLNDALQTVGSTCAEMGRNEACFGHVSIAAQLQDDATGQFTREGDLINVVDIHTLTTDPANPQTGDWGIALMLLQADLPDDSDGAMTFVLFGDAELQQAEVSDSTACSISNTGDNNINIRSAPNTDADIAGTIGSGESGTADGRNAASDWVHVQADDTTGWVFLPLMELACDVETLPVLDDDAPPQSTAPSFLLTTANSEGCDRAPDGLLIRSPEGRRARVIVNGVELTFSSAGFLTADPNGDMTVQGLEGSIDVTVDDLGGIPIPELTPGGQTETVLPNFITSVPLQNAQPTGPPTPPVQIDPNTDLNLPALNAANATVIFNDIGIESCVATVLSDVDAFTGPGEQFPLADRLFAETTAHVIRQSLDADEMQWWQVDVNKWVRADAVSVVGSCSSLPGRQILSASVDPISTANGETPTCGLIWNESKTNGEEVDDMLVEGDFYFVADTHVFLRTARDFGNGGVGLVAEDPNGESIIDDYYNPATPPDLSNSIIVSEDGTYYLRGYNGGGPLTTGTIYAVAVCP